MELRGTGTAAKPHDQCTDIDEDSQEWQDAVRTILTLEQQDGCQGGKNDELLPGGVHEKETEVSRHARKPHVGETGVSQHIRKSHVEETGLVSTSGNLMKGRPGLIDKSESHV